jgi:hypothetical protein
MDGALAYRPSDAPAAAGTGWSSRPGWISAGFLVALLSATAVARLTGHNPDQSAPPASEPIASSQAWLATHDYRMIAELQGARTRYVTVVRHGHAVQGDVQTVRPGRRTGYYRFRLHGNRVETTTTGSLGVARWTPATAAQEALVTHVTDPQWMLAPFQRSRGLRDRGHSGDAEMYRTLGGDTLFMVEGRPLQVVTHAQGIATRSFRITGVLGPPTPDG